MAPPERRAINGAIGGLGTPNLSHGAPLVQHRANPGHPPWAAAPAVILTALILTSCTPAAPGPTPTPSTPQPTFQCTPESGEGDPSPCTSAEYERMQERDALYTEAERILRRSNELSHELRLNRLPINDELTKLLTGEALESTAQTLLEGQKSDETWSGERTLAWVRRAPNISDLGSVVALESCSEPGTFRITGGDGRSASPPPFFQQSFYVIVEGSLRLNSGLFYEAESC